LEEIMVGGNRVSENVISTRTRDRRVILSGLWIFAVLNYIYADILTLYFGSALQPDAWHKLLSTGQVGSIHATQGVVLVGGIVLETAIAMTLLARVLPYRVNRWANIVVAAIQTLSVAITFRTALYANLFYWFFAVIEIATTLFIIWYAWTWPRPEEAAV
jgi:hypothetical protein